MSSCNHSVIKPKSSFFQNSSSSDTKVKRACTIECVLVRDDGQQVPIQIDHSNSLILKVFIIIFMQSVTICNKVMLPTH